MKKRVSKSKKLLVYEINPEWDNGEPTEIIRPDHEHFRHLVMQAIDNHEFEHGDFVLRRKYITKKQWDEAGKLGKEME